MKKFFTKPLVLITLLCVTMVSTFAVSFAYWKSGVDGSSEDKILNINIGQGNAIETEVKLDAVSLDGKALIPSNRDPGENQTNIITFTVNVTWIADGLNGSDRETFGSHKGQLTVDCKKIMLGDKNVIEWEGLGGYPLFDVSPSQNYYDIYGNDLDGVDVQITILMREPADKDQYLAIAGKGISVTLSFVIQSQYELGNS